MSVVGIVANPASGRDIRRLVAQGSVFGNDEKVRLVRRALVGLAAVGVREALVMPDSFGIGHRAQDGLHTDMSVRVLEMRARFDQEDSTRAARLMIEQGAACIIVLGGDGTNRVVSRGCGEVPLVSVSTGTNNVFPSMLEGTVSGMAAGLVATGAVPLQEVARRRKRLDVWVEGELRDQALIDLAVSTDPFVGARALWDATQIQEVVLTCAIPGSIGLSALGAAVQPISMEEPRGLHLQLGEGGQRAWIPIAPGLVKHVPIRAHRVLELGDVVPLNVGTGTIALDGERELETRGGAVEVRLHAEGPWVVHVPSALQAASQRGLFLSNGTF
jgi:predicted polyphosphate/ATP-dependent NAD kinase